MGWHTERVWKLAKQRGWTDSELARRMKVSHTMLYRVRQGQAPSPRFQQGLSAAFPEFEGWQLCWYAADESREEIPA